MTGEGITAGRLADLLSWQRAPDGDWCVLCQWQEGHIPRFAARIYAGMDRRRFVRDPVKREKVGTIWATVRRFG